MKSKSILTMLGFLFLQSQIVHAACKEITATANFCNSGNASSVLYAQCVLMNNGMNVSPRVQAKLKNGLILLIGGLNGKTASNRTFYFNPATSKICETGTMREARIHHFDAVELSDGKVLIAGGDTSSRAVTASAEVFDPQLGLWQSVGSLAQPSRMIRLAIMPNGNVLAVGGQLGPKTTYKAFASSQVYNVSLKSFEQPVSLDIPRSHFALGKHSDGRMLLVGGMAINPAVSSAYISPSQDVLAYNPSNRAWSNLGALLPESRIGFSPSDISPQEFPGSYFISNSLNQITLKNSYSPIGSWDGLDILVDFP